MTYKPHDYRSETPPPRVIGEEYELTHQNSFAIGSLTSAQMAEAGFPNAKTTSKNFWLTNGTNHHTELDSLWEASTAEGLGPREAVLNGSATLATVRAIASSSLIKGLHPDLEVYFCGGSYYAPLPKDPKSTPPVPSYAKRSVNLNLMSIEGLPSDAFSAKEILNTHYLTALWAGVGMLAPNGFQILQRDVTSRHTGPTITALKAGDDVISTAWLRAERRIGEANRSTYVNFAQYAAASLALRIYEHQGRFTQQENERFRGCMVADPTYELGRIAKDLTLNATMICVDGKERTSLQIQRIILERAKELSTKITLPPDELEGMAYWERLLDIMGSINLLDGDLDNQLKVPSRYMHWAMHLRHLGRHTDDPNKPNTWSAYDRQLNLHSIRLSRIAPDDPLEKYAERTAQAIIPNFRDAVTERTEIPGQGRAMARRTLVQFIIDGKLPTTEFGITWRTVKDSFQTHELDPFDSDIPANIKLIQS